MPCACVAVDDRDRGQVGRERGPRAVLDLRDLAAEVVLDHELLAGRHAHASSRRPRPGRRAARTPGRIEIRSRGLDVLDRQVAAGHRREADEAADLDVLRARSRHSPPRERSTPLDAQHVRLDPLDLRRRARRGSGRDPGRAARRRRCRSRSRPSASDGGHDDVLGRHHARLVEEDRACRAAPARASRSGRRSSISAPSSASAWMCGSSRRRPITSPPGGGTIARPKRASSGPASRNEARMRRQSSSSSSVFVHAAPCRRGPRSRRVHSTSAPMSASSSSIVCDVADPRHVRQRHRLGREHAGREDRQGAVLVPGRADRPAERASALDHEGLHAPVAERSRHAGRRRYRRRPMELTRDRAWETLTRYTKSESLRRHALAVEASTRSYARRFGEDEELWGVTALLHDFDYEIHPTLDKHPQDGAPILREEGYPEERDRGGALARRAPRDAARHAAQEDALRLRRALRLRPRVRARAADRPRGPRAEVGQEEAEAAVVRGRRPPRRGLRGRRAARRSSSTSTSRTSSPRCSRSRRSSACAPPTLE